ncbi:hypothetical protein PR003_g8881 [Phytophthora rubi]|uniref:Uncharacterized protein n=2 Tax=Phytophthora rubi TaxID=129364 RepID=A0A6A4FHV5_9STRA|nr:hypothetical protein PR003_g8881 [Phytophthora rubi]
MLETQHTQLVTSSKLTAWYAVIEYFRLFRRGVPSPQQAPPRATDSIPSSEERRQLEFLRSTMAKNVVVGGQEGVKVLIQQWRRYSTYFDDLQLHLRHVSQASEVVFTASATLCVTISETTIRRVFSHLDFAPTTDRQQVKMPTLRSNLRGRRLKLPYRVMFEWDEEIKQVARVDTMIDFFTPIFHAVGTIEDAAFVMENARINLDSSIGEPSN